MRRALGTIGLVLAACGGSKGTDSDSGVGAAASGGTPDTGGTATGAARDVENAVDSAAAGDVVRIPAGM